MTTPATQPVTERVPAAREWAGELMEKFISAYLYENKHSAESAIAAAVAAERERLLSDPVIQHAASMLEQRLAPGRAPCGTWQMAREVLRAALDTSRKEMP